MPRQNGVFDSVAQLQHNALVGSRSSSAHSWPPKNCTTPGVILDRSSSGSLRALKFPAVLCRPATRSGSGVATVLPLPEVAAMSARETALAT
eukprot:4254733-Pyramimonas_sp.AAC.1